MLVTGLSYDDFARITKHVSERKYGGNITVNEYRVFSGNRFRVTLRAADSHGAGARRSHSGRRGPWACWHAYRDVLMGVFGEYPEARIRTGLAARNGAAYIGAAGFRANYPDTGFVNIGSRLMPATMPELCECGGNEPQTAAEYAAIFPERAAEFWTVFTSQRRVPSYAGRPDPLVFGR